MVFKRLHSCTDACRKHEPGWVLLRSRSSGDDASIAADRRAVHEAFDMDAADSNRLTTDMYRKDESVLVTAAGGAISSPRYPNSYPRNLLLSWRLLSPPGTRIHLEFDTHFGLEEPENGVCRYDFVEAEDRSETSTIIWGRWCGQKAPPGLNSKTNVLRVTFKSDDYFVAKPGFKVYYSLL
ncbi:platelet-derived growth factor D-like, partial [Lampris incognitus]|uniref:platelet-derived growth factor D-like n=1 Tax=Lampris incognitus TaxID=2546036 RepID=UPI0024B5D40A